MVDSQKLLLRTLIDNVYDLQSTRIAAGNRLVASLRQMGIIAAKNPEGLNLSAQAVGKSGDQGEEDSKDKEQKENDKLLIKIIDEYELVSNIYAERFGNRGHIQKALDVIGSDAVYIRTELTYNMVSIFLRLLKTEQAMLDVCSKEVKKHPLWNAFFKDIKGCGPLMSAVCISYLDPL